MPFCLASALGPLAADRRYVVGAASIRISPPREPDCPQLLPAVAAAEGGSFHPARLINASWRRVRLEDRLEHQPGRGLHDPVAQCGDAQASELPRALRDQPLAGRQRTIGACLELLAELGEDTIDANLLDPLARLTIDTGGLRPPVAFHPLPRDHQGRGVAEEVEQIAEALVLVLACPAVQLGLPSQYPLLRQLDGRQRRGRLHARPPERPLTLQSCCPPSPCGRLSRPRTSTRTPPRPAPISRHRALPGCHQQPGAHGALPTFTMIRLTGLATGSTPTALPSGTRSIPPATAPRFISQARSEPPLISADFRAARSALLFRVCVVEAVAAPPGHGGVGEVGCA